MVVETFDEGAEAYARSRDLDVAPLTERRILSVTRSPAACPYTNGIKLQTAPAHSSGRRDITDEGTAARKLRGLAGLTVGVGHPRRPRRLEPPRLTR